MIQFESRLFECLRTVRLQNSRGILRRGRISRAVGLTLVAKGFHQPVGARCWVKLNEKEKVEAEVVGFDNDSAHLMSISHTQGIAPGMLLTPSGQLAQVGVDVGEEGAHTDRAIRAVGEDGIEVGMATSIPPHNAAELCDAALHLIEQSGGKIVGSTFFIELSFLNGREKLRGHGPVHALITY